MNDIFEKFQWLFMIIVILFGLALGQITYAADLAALFIMPFIIIMLFGVFLQVPLKNLRKALLNKKVTALSLAINFFWTPLFAFGLSRLFFYDSPDVFIALIMDLVTPCTDWHLVFTGIAGGHLALSTALLPWNLPLQLTLLPLHLFLFAGTVVEIELLVFIRSFVSVLLVPFLAVVTARQIIIHSKGERWFTQKILNKLDPFQSIFLLLAIMAIFTSQGTILLENINLVLRLIIPVSLFFAVNFILGHVISRVARLSYQEWTSLIMTTLARNAPLALTIAVAVFPGRPFIPLVLAVESLIELPILFVLAQLLLLIYLNKWWPREGFRQS